MQETTSSRESQTDDQAARRKVLRPLGLAATAPLIGLKLSHAQAVPDTVRLVAGLPAGSPVEAPARALGQALSATTGRTYIIDNKPGAGGNIAANEVAKAKPDGSSMLWTFPSHTIAPAIYQKLPFDAIADFTPITRMVTSSGYSLLVRRESPYRSVNDLIRAAQQNPGKVSYASLGIGNTIHLIGELFGIAAKAKFLHVPYRTSQIPDLLGGHVDFTFLANSLIQQMIDAGSVRVLAVTSKTRFKSAPDAPTLTEMGMGHVDVPAWGGWVGPRGMSAETANRIQQEIKSAVQHKSFVDWFNATSDNTILVDTPAEFGAYLKSEVDRIRKLLAPLNLSLDAGF